MACRMKQTVRGHAKICVETSKRNKGNTCAYADATALFHEKDKLQLTMQKHNWNSVAE